MNHHAGIIIGINHYQCFQPLSFAQQDAQQLHEFLVEEGGFSSDLCVEMTETSPHMADRPTYPTRSNLGWTIDRICRHLVQPGDVLWFFFSGYGVTWEGEDYLMPIDGKPNDIPGTGIWMRSLLETLKYSAADQVFVLLDVNRATGCINGQGMGQRTVELAKELEIPTVLSCQVDQFSRETAAVEQGFFTSALLEALRTGCKTLDSLEQYLSSYLPQLSEQNFRPPQNPLWMVYPPAKLNQAVLPVPSSEDNSLMTKVQEIGDRAINPTGISTILAPYESQEKISLPQILPEFNRNLEQQPSAIAPDQTEEKISDLKELSDVNHDSIETPEAIAPDPTEEKITQQEISEPQPSTMKSQKQEDPEAIAPDPTPKTEEKTPEPQPSEPSELEAIDQTADPNPSLPTTSVTPPPNKKSKSLLESLLDNEGKSWIPMVVVGVILILAAGIGLAKLNQFIEQKESETPIPGNNPTEPVKQPVAQDSPAAVSDSTNPTANPTASPTPEPTEPVKQPIAQDSPAAVSDSSNPTASPTPEPSGNLVDPADMTPSVTQVKLPENNRVVAIEKAQASTFIDAIQKARQIRPSDPNYQQAQENIQNWSQVILDIAKVRAVNGNWSGAIAAVELVPNDRQDVYTQAQQFQSYATAQLELENTYKQLLDEADNSVILGDASSYAEAIGKIRAIQEGQPLYPEARARVEWWSMRIWQIASARANKGQINLAIQTARLIPEDSKVYANAQQALKQWQP